MQADVVLFGYLVPIGVILTFLGLLVGIGLVVSFALTVLLFPKPWRGKHTGIQLTSAVCAVKKSQCLILTTPAGCYSEIEDVRRTCLLVVEGTDECSGPVIRHCH